MKTAVAVLVLLVASGRDLAATPQQGAPQRNAPCRDCWLLVPQHPVGLLVVLHGDDAGASSAFLDWRDAARHAGLALLAPQCPSDRGCTGS